MNVAMPVSPYCLGVCDESEASGHLAVDDVIFRASLGVGALFSEDPVEVTVKRLLLPRLRIESFRRSQRYPRTKWASWAVLLPASSRVRLVFLRR